MAKLRKRISKVEKEKDKVEIGKITKSKGTTEVSKMRKPQEVLNSPSRVNQSNLRNLSSVTPFMRNSTLNFTSTPMNIEDTKSNGRELRNKFVSRLALSPILKNVCSTKQSNEKNSLDSKTRKIGNIAVVKENLPIRNMKHSKFNKESFNPGIPNAIHNTRTIGRKASVSENSGKLAMNENTESSSSRLRVRLRRIDNSLSSDSDSSKRSSRNTLHKHASDSSSPDTSSRHHQSSRNTLHKHASDSSSLDTSSRHHRDSGNTQYSVGKKQSLVRRLRSDWSSTTFDETSNGAQSSLPTTKETEKNDVRQNKCSKLRVRLRRSIIDVSSTSKLPSIDVNPKRQHKSCYDTSLTNYLISNGTGTTFGNSKSQPRTPSNNQIPRKQLNKRKLTPLVEMSMEDTDISTAIERPSNTSKEPSPTKSNSNEEGYSSSAEFQSDDDTNNQNRSKRAPTWKDLLNKSSELPALRKKQSPVVRLLRGRKLGSTNGKDRAENKVAKSQQKGIDKTSGDNNQDKIASEVPLNIYNKTNEGPSGNNDKLDVRCEPFKQIHDNAEQILDSVEGVRACEESIAVSTPQQSNLQKESFDKNTSAFPQYNGDAEKCETIDLTCPVKFFHSRSGNPLSQSKAQQNFTRPTSKRRKKQESIYEFLSQSSSESNNPVDDVIQKMIKTGKAVVAKHKKGTGKNVVPRKRPTAKIQKKKQTVIEEITQKPKKPLVEKPRVREQQRQEDFDNDLHFGDDFHFDDGENYISEEDQVRDQRGFSNLARSAMIKQAGRIQKPLQRKPITDKKKLLAMAMQFVSQSTPIRMSPQPISSPKLSPLPGNKSPWRVTDDKLPNLFYLGRDSNNLPSFSSDYIPMTPSKNKSKSLSSFSSNDSNGENTAPPGAKIVTNEANLQALTNTRKALTYRSPLKAINIIDVVNLPPLALHSYGRKSSDANESKINSKAANNSSINKTARNILGNISIHKSINNSNQSNNSSNNNSNRSSNQSKIDDFCDQNAENQPQNFSNSSNDIQNNNATDLFGFEELIDDSESNSKDIIVDKTILPNKNVLKERLERLKQLRPNKPVVISDKKQRIKPVFDNVRPQQRTLKQMLCSTMIDKNQDNRDEENQSYNETGDLSNLFRDIEPETTFDESLPRRTYNRPFKRKRKVLSNYATMMDSDVSEDEEEVEKRPIKNYKAKPNKRKKIDIEMKKFVNEFNEMCKEVSQYELVVE